MSTSSRINTASVIRSAHAISQGDSPPAPRLDSVDALAAVTLPDFIDAPRETAASDADAITREGARGPAIRRLLGAEIALRRLRLRSREALSAVVLEAYAAGRGSADKVRVLEDAVDHEYDRFLRSLAMLLRVTGNSGAPVVAVRAHQAQINIANAEGQR